MKEKVNDAIRRVAIIMQVVKFLGFLVVQCIRRISIQCLFDTCAQFINS